MLIYSIHFFVILSSAASNLMLAKYFSINIVHSSLIASLVWIFVYKLIKRKDFYPYFYLGIFIGMSTYQINNFLISLALSSLISTFLMEVLKEKLIGHGGKLGTIAFIACLIPYLLNL